MPKELVSLIVLDGWGLSEDDNGNAIKAANTPNFDKLIKEYPNTVLTASGLSVGLPEGQMGNSEVGHLNIGAGRIVYQDFTRISKAIKNYEFYNKEEFIEAIDLAKKNNSKLHLMGLFSEGGVHSHNSHLFALLELAKRRNFNEVYIHAFLDGRDVPPKTAKKDLTQFSKKIEELGVGNFATISGRFYAMDRDKRWERVKKAYDALVLGNGRSAGTVEEAINRAYEEDLTDEFVIPTVICRGSKPTATIEDNDSVIFFNFRPDRAREITRAIVDKEFDGFIRDKIVNTNFVCMTQYDRTIENVKVAYKPQNHTNTLGEYVSKLGYKQLRIAETEKYAHVTFFFNGGVEQSNKDEDRVLIPSPKVETYDMMPEMSAEKLKDQVIKRISEYEYDLIVLNFANPDMVGHTGDFDAAVNAVETVDNYLGEVVDEILKVNGKVIITADHGNAEQMKDENGNTLTAHSSNKVPCILVGADNIKLREGILADIAPTILELFDLDIPQEMTGNSLIIK